MTRTLRIAMAALLCATLLCATLLCATCAFVLADDDVTVSRDRIIERLREHIALSPGMRKRPKRLQDLVQSRLLEELPALAESVLPEALTGTSLEDVERVLNRPLVLDHPNKDYNSLLLKKHLLETMFLLGVGRQTSGPCEESRQAVRDNISRIVEGARTLAKKHAAHLVPEATVDAMLAEAERMLVDTMNDQTLLALKHPVDDTQIDEWIATADGLLSKNIAAANQRLGRMSQYLVAGEVDALKQKAAEHLVRAMGPQIVQMLTKMTADAQLGSVDADAIAPGYEAACQALEQMKARLSKGKRR